MNSISLDDFAITKILSLITKFDYVRDDFEGIEKDIDEKKRLAFLEMLLHSKKIGKMTEEEHGEEVNFIILLYYTSYCYIIRKGDSSILVILIRFLFFYDNANIYMLIACCVFIESNFSYNFLSKFYVHFKVARKAIISLRSSAFLIP